METAATTPEDAEFGRVYLENLIGVHITGNMFINYVLASKKQRAELKGEKDQLYIKNKMVDAANEVNKLIKPLSIFLHKHKILEDIGGEIESYHTLDRIFGLRSDEIKRVDNLIDKIIKTRSYEGDTD